MKKVWTAVLIALVVLCSCMETPSSDEGYVRLGIAKDLSSDTDSVLSFFEYRSTPLFELKDHPIQGQADWRQVGAMDGVSDRVGPFTQGLWRLEIHACNRAGIVLYTDTKEIWISRGRISYIAFDAHRAEGEGYVEVDVSVPRNGTEASLEAVFDDGETQSTYTQWNVEETDDMRRYTGRLAFPSGSYTVTFRTPGGGEAVGIEVLAGQTGHIKGWIYPSRYPAADLEVSGPEERRGHIEGAKDISLGESLDLSLVMDLGSSDDCFWYVDGEKVADGGFYTFTPDRTGLFEIVCVSYRLMEGYVESTSAYATIRVRP